MCQLAHEQGIDLSLSRQKHRRVESIELVRSERDGNRAELAFQSRPFVLCGLPIRRPPAGTLQYTRRNGRFKLDIIAHPEFGPPFGQDRLIPIWVATLAVKQKSRTVMFRSAAEILDHFDLPKDGPHYRRLVVSSMALSESSPVLSSLGPTRRGSRNRQFGIIAGSTSSTASAYGAIPNLITSVLEPIRVRT